MTTTDDNDPTTHDEGDEGRGNRAGQVVLPPPSPQVCFSWLGMALANSTIEPQDLPNDDRDDNDDADNDKDDAGWDEGRRGRDDGNGVMAPTMMTSGRELRREVHRVVVTRTGHVI
jgi:hypothetical protein